MYTSTQYYRILPFTYTAVAHYLHPIIKHLLEYLK